MLQNITKYCCTGAVVAGVVLVTQYYKSDPPIVSNNNIWLSASLRFPRLAPAHPRYFNDFAPAWKVF